MCKLLTWAARSVGGPGRRPGREGMSYWNYSGYTHPYLYLCLQNRGCVFVCSNMMVVMLITPYITHTHTQPGPVCDVEYLLMITMLTCSWVQFYCPPLPLSCPPLLLLSSPLLLSLCPLPLLLSLCPLPLSFHLPVSFHLPLSSPLLLSLYSPVLSSPSLPPSPPLPLFPL